ncbi:MAG TPA: hypothetical protein VK503_05320, partial [Candidatus Bathyarchaeia archaeon]|nr:hypothetical protein [Candidatus Bathyarchaeia archaeon]
MPAEASPAATFIFIKVFGDDAKLERTIHSVKGILASNTKVACLVMDDLLRRELLKRGIDCASFQEQIDVDMEEEAWRKALWTKGSMKSYFSSYPLIVKDCVVPEWALGIDADQFGFISVVVAVKNKMASRGFSTVVLILDEQHLFYIPDIQLKFCYTVVSRLGIHRPALLDNSLTKPAALARAVLWTGWFWLQHGFEEHVTYSS